MIPRKPACQSAGADDGAQAAALTEWRTTVRAGGVCVVLISCHWALAPAARPKPIRTENMLCAGTGGLLHTGPARDCVACALTHCHYCMPSPIACGSLYMMIPLPHMIIVYCTRYCTVRFQATTTGSARAWFRHATQLLLVLSVQQASFPARFAQNTAQFSRFSLGKLANCSSSASDGNSLTGTRACCCCSICFRRWHAVPALTERARDGGHHSPGTADAVGEWRSCRQPR